jgi:predicted CoA-substrate-specific enzyme activase
MEASKKMDGDQLFWGVDCGSTQIKVCVCDGEGRILHKRKGRTLFPLMEHVRKTLSGEDSALTPLTDDQQSVKENNTIVATGYGRNHIEFAQGKLTEISAHFLGAQRLLQLDQPYTIVDIGGQDSKVIEVHDGRVGQFVINRKCAAGTGAFIEELAHRLEVRLEDLTELARAHDKDMTLNSYCTVFSGQEVIKILMHGERLENLIHALYASVVQRILEMTNISTDTVVFSGGVMNFNPVLLDLFKEKLPRNQTILIEDAQYCGAYGAALFASGLAEKQANKFSQSESKAKLATQAVQTS